ncbi:MAG: AI-2E family transporter [Alkalispirochaeta sp.]
MSDRSGNNGDTIRAASRPIRIPQGILRANAAYLFIIALVAVGTVLHLTGEIFIPFVIAVLLSFVFSPVVTFLTRRKVPRVIAIAFVLIIFLAFGYLIVQVVYSTAQSLLREFPRYQQRFVQLLHEVIVRFDLPPTIIADLEVTRTVGNMIVSLSGNLMSFLSSYMLVFIFLLFLLIEKPYVRKKMALAVRDETTRRFNRVLIHINSQIGRYIGVKLFVSALTAVIVYTAFNFIGVGFPFIWAVLTFLFNFIPSIGSIAITFITAVFAMVQFLPNWNPVIATIVSMATTQFLIGNLLDPKLLGDRLNLSPVVILLSLLLWGWLWGTAGLFLAVPLTVAIKIVFENIPGMEAVGILMGTGNFKPRNRRRRNARSEQPD